MKTDIKFNIKLISFDKNKLDLKYENKSEENIIVKTMRLHNTSISANMPEHYIYRCDVIERDLEFTIPLDEDNSRGVTFVVKDETHKEQYSIGINFSNGEISIKNMMYGG